jgi:hypothetical protein
MAASKTYVEIAKMSVKDAFDAKYTSTLPKVMEKAAEKAIKASSQLTLDPPKEKGATGFSLDGSLVSIGPDKTGKKLEGKFSAAISTWPGKSIKAMPSSNAGMPVSDPKKIDAGDVEAVAESLVESAMKEAVKYMEKNK